MSQLPVIETPRTFLLLLQAENSRLVQAYHLANREHLAAWKPERGTDFFTDESFRKLGAASYSAFLAGSAVKFIAVHRASEKMVARCSFTNIVKRPTAGLQHGLFSGQGV